MISAYEHVASTMPSSNETGGCATRTTSPNAMPHTTPASAAFDAPLEIGAQVEDVEPTYEEPAEK